MRKHLFDIIYMSALTLFTIYLVYQILKKVFGGSWIADSLLIGMVLMLLTLVIQIVKELSRLKSDVSHLSRDYRSFKKEMRGFKQEMLDFKEETNRNFTKLFNILE